MKEAGQDLLELRREVVETRNQMIRTDNQLKNVATEVKAFDRRFETLERRVRLAGLGSQIIVALVVAVAGYGVHAVRTGMIKADTRQRVQTAQDEAATLRSQSEKWKQRVEVLERESSRRAAAEKASNDILDRLDKRQEKEATELLDSLSFDDLSAVEKRVLASTVGELRRRSAETAFKNGKNLLAADRTDQGIAELKRSLELDPEGRLAIPARYLLAMNLWDQKHYEEVEQITRELLTKSQDRALLDDLRFLLATSMAEQSVKDSGKKEEAKRLLRDAIRSGGRYANQLRMVLAALEQNAEIPDLSGRGAKSAGRRPDASTPPPTSPQPSANAQPPVAAPAP